MVKNPHGFAAEYGAANRSTRRSDDDEITGFVQGCRHNGAVGVVVATMQGTRPHSRRVRLAHHLVQDAGGGRFAFSVVLAVGTTTSGTTTASSRAKSVDDGIVTVRTTTRALREFARLMPWRAARSERSEPSTASRMLLNMLLEPRGPIGGAVPQHYSMKAGNVALILVNHCRARRAGSRLPCLSLPTGLDLKGS
jgi:hypothetical protein